jgi:hypothetical protein
MREGEVNTAATKQGIVLVCLYIFFSNNKCVSPDNLNAITDFRSNPLP